MSAAAVPLILQSDVGDCSAACAAMLVRAVADAAPVPLASPTDRRGTLADVVATAARAGVALRAVRVPATAGTGAGVMELPLPAICRLDGNHYVVLTGRRRRTVRLNDPMQGRLSMACSTFADRWDGVAVVPRVPCPPARWSAVTGRVGEVVAVLPLLRPGCGAPAAYCAGAGALCGAAATGPGGGVGILLPLAAAAVCAARIGPWSDRMARHGLAAVQVSVVDVPDRVQPLRQVREQTAELALPTVARHLLLAVSALSGALAVLALNPWPAVWTAVLPVVAGLSGTTLLRVVDAASREGERRAHVRDAEVGAVVQAGSAHRRHPDVLAFTVRRALALHEQSTRAAEQGLPVAALRGLALVLAVAVVVLGPAVLRPLGAGGAVLALLVLSASWSLTVVALQADALSAARQFRDHWTAAPATTPPAVHPVH